MVTFDELEFRERDPRLGGIGAKAFFPNGYGASVVRGPRTYGGREGLYELAVLQGNAAGWRLTYDTPIADNVLGYLSPADVTRLLAEIEALPALAMEPAA